MGPLAVALAVLVCGRAIVAQLPAQVLALPFDVIINGVT